MTLNQEQLKDAMKTANKAVPMRQRTYEESPVYITATIGGETQTLVLTGAKVEQQVTGEHGESSDPTMFLQAVDLASLLEANPGIPVTID